MDDMMMKYAETIQVRRNEALEQAICVGATEIIGESGMNTIVELNPKAIIEAIKKQIPIKVVNVPSYDYSDVPYTAVCPHCKMTLGWEAQHTYNYCFNCGQALKWGE